MGSSLPLFKGEFKEGRFRLQAFLPPAGLVGDGAANNHRRIAFLFYHLHEIHFIPILEGGYTQRLIFIFFHPAPFFDSPFKADTRTISCKLNGGGKDDGIFRLVLGIEVPPRPDHSGDVQLVNPLAQRFGAVMPGYRMKAQAFGRLRPEACKGT